jgi:hypothetical protein
MLLESYSSKQVNSLGNRNLKLIYQMNPPNIKRIKSPTSLLKSSANKPKGRNTEPTPKPLNNWFEIYQDNQAFNKEFIVFQ